MSRVRYEYPAGMVAWAAVQLAGAFPADATAIGFERDAGDLLAVAVFHSFETRQCRISIAALPRRRWLIPKFARHAAAYPFITCGLARVTAVIAERNAPALRLAEHLGFVREGRLREAARDGGDEIVLGMLGRECRWLPRTLAPARQTADFAV